MKKENGNVYVNLTEVAKSFPEKNLTNIINTQEISDYVEKLSKLQNYSLTDLVQVTRGGATPGTWAHQKVALRVCQKLSTDFAIMVDTKIEELLTQGYTTLDTINRKELAKMILQQEEEKEKLQSRIDCQSQKLNDQAPKVLFASAVETSQKSCLIGELAKIIRQNGIDMGEKRLFEWLRRNGYLCAHGERYNQPTQKAMDLGLFEIKKTTITKPSGEILISTTSKVTGKGQIYFVSKFLKNVA